VLGFAPPLAWGSCLFFRALVFSAALRRLHGSRDRAAVRTQFSTFVRRSADSLCFQSRALCSGAAAGLGFTPHLIRSASVLLAAVSLRSTSCVLLVLPGQELLVPAQVRKLPGDSFIGSGFLLRPCRQATCVVVRAAAPIGILE
jgi:hypothetical protein